MIDLSKDVTNDNGPISDEHNTDNESAVTLEDVKNVFALHGKNCGCSLQLRGKVVLIAFLVNDGESHWDAASQAALVEVLKSASERLMVDSRLGKQDLQIAYAYCQVSVPYVVNRKTSKNCVFDVLRQFGYKSVSEYQKHYEQKFERDETSVSFVFNKTFRSYATQITNNVIPEEPMPVGEEYSMVSFEKNNHNESEKSFLHELMHQFGAIDYYYPEYLKFKAEKFFPGSIMNDGMVIDDLTRFVIGWDDKPTQQAVDFLNAISAITEADVEYARREELIGDGES